MDLLDPSLVRAWETTQRPSISHPSFQALNLLEFAFHCFRFVPSQGKVFISVVLFLAVAFFPINTQVLLERKKQV